MRVMLAPMEGVIDPAMRRLLTGLGGVDRCVTEFLRVCDRLLPPRVFRRLCPELDQGGRTRAGVPERVSAIVAAVRRAVPAQIPVTAKIRLGFEDRSPFLDNVRAIAEAGASELTVHARTRRDGYRPPAWWEEISRAREAAPGLPIIANGEIWSADDARRCREVTGCSDLMLGRGALCRPDLPRLVAASLRGEAGPEPLAWREILPLLAEFLDLNLACYDRGHAANPFKQWLVYLRAYYPQAARFFEEIKRLRQPDDIARALAQASEDAYPDDRVRAA